jgi:hypothetical protein
MYNGYQPGHVKEVVSVTEQQTCGSAVQDGLGRVVWWSSSVNNVLRFSSQCTLWRHLRIIFTRKTKGEYLVVWVIVCVCVILPATGSKTQNVVARGISHWKCIIIHWCWLLESLWWFTIRGWFNRPERLQRIYDFGMGGGVAFGKGVRTVKGGYCMHVNMICAWLISGASVRVTVTR